MKVDSVRFDTIPLFKGLSPADLDTVRAIFDIRDLDAGQTLLTEGESGDEMFILVKGRVSVSKSMLMPDMDLPLLEVSGLRKTLATMDDAEYPVFGEIALFDQNTRSATIHVLEPSRFLVTDHTRFFQLAQREPAIGNVMQAALAKRMAATIRNTNGELVKMATALALALTRCGSKQ